MTLEEIYQALLDGKKLKFLDHPNLGPVYLKDGKLRRDNGIVSYCFDNPENWAIWEPPPKEYTFAEVLEILCDDNQRRRVFTRKEYPNNPTYQIKRSGSLFVNDQNTSFVPDIFDAMGSWIEVL